MALSNTHIQTRASAGPVLKVLRIQYILRAVKLQQIVNKLQENMIHWLVLGSNENPREPTPFQQLRVSAIASLNLSTIDEILLGSSAKMVNYNCERHPHRFDCELLLSGLFQVLN